MSKLKKLLINPIRFFKDSWVFFSSNISKIQGVQNLFVISHLGQLGQVEALII
ncbi:poly-alpha-2,8 sialosyl sialyltransferase, partial [Pasteurellaceae bacterium Phil11]